MGSGSLIAKKMRHGSVEREQMAKNTPHEAHKRVLSVFGVPSGKQGRPEQPRSLQGRL